MRQHDLTEAEREQKTTKAELITARNEHAASQEALARAREEFEASKLRNEQAQAVQRLAAETKLDAQAARNETDKQATNQRLNQVEWRELFFKWTTGAFGLSTIGAIIVFFRKRPSEKVAEEIQHLTREKLIKENSALDVTLANGRIPLPTHSNSDAIHSP